MVKDDALVVKDDALVLSIWRGIEVGRNSKVQVHVNESARYKHT